MRLPIFAALCALAALAAEPAAQAVEYDIVYIRAPRFGNSRATLWPEVFRPTQVDPGADLVLRHPDGAEEVLVAGGTGAITDPFVSFDAQWVYYARFPDVRDSSAANNFRPSAGSDIYRIHLKTRTIERLTHQEFTPNAAYKSPNKGVFNLGPAPLPGGKVVFTSNRNGFLPTKPFSTINLQLFVMDTDGSNVTAIAPMTLGSALHPTPLMDGRVMFSSYESQGLRDWKQWGLWTIWPDGRVWEPLFSAFRMGQAFHFQTQLSDGDIVVIDYYNLNNGGFGVPYRFPTNVPGPMFSSAVPAENPPLTYTAADGTRIGYRIPFSPKGLVTLMPWSSPGDEPSFRGSGKVTHPSGAPNGDCLVTYAAGPANLRTTGIIDSGIYRLPGCGPTTGPNALVRIVNDPAYNETFPRAVVPYRAIYGIDEPKSFPWLPNDGTVHPALPAGTPYGIVGTSSVYNRESAPGDGLEAFNGPGVVTATGALANNWVSQGSDAGIYDNSEIDAIRIVTLEPTTESVAPWSPQGERLWLNHAIERTRILGEIPLRKPGVIDAQGNPDTSFSAKIPADVPFTFQLIDRNGMLLTMAQTWHQVRPGEVRTDCGGCHAHSKPPLDFATTAAANAPPVDLTKAKPRDVEFLRDIRPILQAKCVSCHRGAAPAGNLALDDLTPTKITSFWLPKGTWPADYLRLAHDPDARWGTKPPSGTTWRHLNASRYVRMFQSRRSLLVWKIFGRRMDGQTNDTWKDDLDYAGTIMPPPDSGLTLTDAERRTIATWIDLGAPIDGGAWFDDETRPTLTVSSPRPNENLGPLTEIRIGIADHYSGLDLQSLSVTADAPLAGHRRGEELAKFGSFTGDGIFSIALDPPLTGLDRARLTVKIKDRRGNVTEQTVRFWVGAAGTTAAARRR